MRIILIGDGRKKLGFDEDDYEQLKKSSATLVFGQMNEPPEHVFLWHYPTDCADSFRDSEESENRDIQGLSKYFRLTQAV
jgi:F0F1-type ATP synthase beta subunit